jgi:hypothetical protein
MATCQWPRLSSATSAGKELLEEVLGGTINPGLVLDYETDLDYVADAYACMDERRAIKSLIRIGSL